MAKFFIFSHNHLCQIHKNRVICKAVRLNETSAVYSGYNTAAASLPFNKYYAKHTQGGTTHISCNLYIIGIKHATFGRRRFSKKLHSERITNSIIMISIFSYSRRVQDVGYFASRGCCQIRITALAKTLKDRRNGFKNTFQTLYQWDRVQRNLKPNRLVYDCTQNDSLSSIIRQFLTSRIQLTSQSLRRRTVRVWLWRF